MEIDQTLGSSEGYPPLKRMIPVARRIIPLPQDGPAARRMNPPEPGYGARDARVALPNGLTGVSSTSRAT
jgi:hypothetical protein